MVRRYAHLTPEHLAKAAARIVPIGTKMATVEKEKGLHKSAIDAFVGFDRSG